MRRGFIFASGVILIFVVVFLVGIHLLVVDYRKGTEELARRKGEMVAREVAVNVAHLIDERMDTVEVLSLSFIPLFLEGKISEGELDRGVDLHMRYGGGVTNIQFFNEDGVVVWGYPPTKAMLGLRLDRDLMSHEIFKLFTDCIERRKREVRVVKTLFLDPNSMRLDYEPLLVVMHPVTVGEGNAMKGVLMASLNLCKIVRKSFSKVLFSGWQMALLGGGGEVLWSKGGGGKVGDLFKGGGEVMRVEMPVRVGDQRWSVVAWISKKEVEAGIVSFYWKVEGFVISFLVVLGLSLFLVFKEIRRGYRAVALSEDRFRTLVEGMSEVFYVRDKVRGFSYMSPGAEGKLGVPRKELEETIVSLSPFNGEATVEVGEKVLAVREKRREDAFYGLVRDITTECQLTRNLERERSFLDSMVSSLRAGVMVVDGERRVLWMNTYLKEIYELGDEVEGIPCYTLFAHRKSPCPSCYLDPLLAGRKAQEEVIAKYYVPLLGGERHFFVRTRKVKMEDKERIVVLCQDITEMKHMEEQMYFMDKLSSLGKLAASVAHELSTPLFVTSTNLETVLRKERLTPSARRLLELSAEELRRSVLLLRKLRWVYRPVSMEKEWVNIDQVLRDVAAILRTYARERKVGLNLEITPVEPFPGYKGPLMQVLLNLVTNAVEASPHGGEVTIRAEEEGGELVLTVRDRGVGIPKGMLDQIFKPFVTTKGGKGAGLGLHLTCKMVEGMGGTIEVESQEGEGSVFRVRLPVERGGEGERKDPDN